jgi:16S rRNA (adenine1518-N6/adenine1519-N6)-dimethyltransferase
LTRKRHPERSEGSRNLIAKRDCHALLAMTINMIKPKKYLGQNFLKDQTVLNKIIEAADLKPDDFVIEIGPGEGVLTDELIKKAGHIIAIEKDDNLALRLDSRLRGNDKIKIINDDILKINLPELLCHSERTMSEPSGPNGQSKNLEILQLRPSTDSVQDDIPYKVVANIPYYITSPIIQLFLETKYPPKEIVLMVQKEVAERITAKPGEMSILAASVQYYAKAELLFYVDKKSFWPVPEVDSAVIRISRINEQRTMNNKENTKQFFRIVKAGFAARRKTLLNNLSNSFHLPREVAEEKIKKAGLDPGVRAQELSVEEWKKLQKQYLS